MIKLTDEDRAKYTPKKKKTNLEKIRAMSAEELAGFLYKVTGCCESEDCLSCPMHSIRIGCETKTDVLTWLESEVEE